MISLVGFGILFSFSAAGKNKKSSSNLRAERCLLEEATRCTVSGDPHFTMFNKAIHDFQGYGQYYYAKPCCGVDDDEMPFAIMGKHYQWLAHSSVSLLDYVTLALTDKDGDLYYAHISSEFKCYYPAEDAVSAANPSLYDENIAVCTSLGDTVTAIGKRFDLLVHTRESGVVSITLKIEDEHSVTMRMTPPVNDRFVLAGRNRLHALVIDPFEQYKCYTCGLCGNFASTESTFESCDGGEVSVVAGWASTNAFAYDVTGNTFGVGYCDLETECANDEEDYKCSKGGKDIPDVCSTKLYLAAKELCEDHIESVWECCATLDNDGGCNLAVKDCAIDSCAVVDSVEELDVVTAVENLFDDATAICEGYVKDEADIAEEMMFITTYHRPAQGIMANYLVLAGSAAVFLFAMLCLWNRQKSEQKLLSVHTESAGYGSLA